MRLSIKGRLFVFASNAACSSPARLLLPPLRTCYAVADYDVIALRRVFFLLFWQLFLGGRASSMKTFREGGSSRLERWRELHTNAEKRLARLLC